MGFVYNPFSGTLDTVASPANIQLGRITHEPMGFQDSDQWTIAYDSTTRTMTATPSGEQFIYVQGKRYAFSAPIALQHPDVNAEYFFQIDNTGTLIVSTTPFDFENYAHVCVVFYDNTQTPKGFALKESHGVTMDWATHSHLHNTIGTFRRSGGVVSGVTVYTPADVTNPPLADINPDVNQSVIQDEDLQSTLTAFTQDGVAPYAKLRKQFTTNKWVWDLTDVNAPYFQAANVAQYNPTSGGDVLVNMTNDAYTNYYLFGVPAASGSEAFRFVWIPGQAQYVPALPTTEARTAARDQALAEDWRAMDLTGLPFAEFVPLWKLVVRYNTAYTNNAYRLRVAGSQAIIGTRASASNVSGVLPTVHNNLSGRNAPNAHPLASIGDDNAQAGRVAYTGANGELKTEAGLEYDDNSNILTAPNLTVTGDLIVQGDTVTLNTQTVLVEDNVIVVNNGEVGAGVTAGKAGIQVDRGSLTDYEFVFDEPTDTFRAGEIGSTQALATREDAPIANAVPFWNDSAKRLDTDNGMTYDAGTNKLSVGAVNEITGLAAAESGVVSSSTSGAIGTSTAVARQDHSHDLGEHLHTAPTNGGPIPFTAKKITQANAFSAGQWLYLNGSTYALAKADLEATAEVVGVVLSATGSDFVLVTEGWVDIFSGLTPGESYFLSDSVAGAITATAPTTIGYIKKPVLTAETATTGIVNIMRGDVVGGSNAQTQITLGNNTTTNVQDLSAYDGCRVDGNVFIDGTADYRGTYSIQMSRKAAGTDYSISVDSTTGDTDPGVVFGITSAGMLQCTLPSIAGYVAANFTYSINGPAVGATFPLSIGESKLVPDGGAIGQFETITASKSLSLSSPRLGYVDTPSGAINITLPSVGIKKGYRYRVEVKGATEANYVALIAGTEVDRIGGKGFIEVVALVDTPTVKDDWRVVDVEDITTFTSGACTGAQTGAMTFFLVRRDKQITCRVSQVADTASTSFFVATPTGTLPARFRPEAITNTGVGIITGTQIRSGFVLINTNGQVAFYLYDQGAFSATGNTQSTTFSYRL